MQPKRDPGSALVSYLELVDVLRHARRRLALNTLAGGLVRWLCVAGGGLAVAFVLAAVLPASVAGSMTLSLAWLSLAITCLGAFVALPLVRLPGLEDLAVRLDSSVAPGANTLISSLQLGRDMSAGGGRWVSLPIMKKAVEAGAMTARGMDTRSSTGDAGLGRWIRQLAIVAAFSVAIAALWPHEMRTSAWRLTNPLACGPVPVSLSAGPGNVEVDAGSDITVAAMVVGTGEAPELRVRKRGGVWNRVSMRSERSIPSGIPGSFVKALMDGSAAGAAGGHEAAGGELLAAKGTADTLLGDVPDPVRTPEGLRELPRYFYAYTLAGLEEDREYNVVVAGRETPTWNIEVNQPPRAVAFRITCTFPDYTGLPPHESVSASGDVAALKGAAVEIEVSANRALAGARLSFGPGEEENAAATVEMTPTSDRSFAGAFRLLRDKSYTVTFVEDGGRERLDPRRFTVTPLPDQDPMVRVVSPARSVDLPAEMTLDVSTYAADDYGISSLALVYFMEGGGESRLPLKTYSGAPRELYESHTWDLTELGLLPGEVVYYSVEVLDNDTVSGPKAGRSEVHSVRFPTMEEIYSRVEEDYEQGIDELAEQLRRGEELKEKIEEISREIKSSQELSWEQRQSIKGALSDREELAETAKQMAESLDEIVDKMGGSGLVDEEILEKVMEIQELLSQISDPEIKKAIEQLNEAMAKVDKEAVAKAMEELKIEHEELLKKLDKTIEMLKRLKAEEQMRATRERVEELLKKQEDINSSLEKDEPKGEDLSRLSEEESEVKEGLGDLHESLGELKQALESIDPQVAAQMGEQAGKVSEEGLQKDAQEAAERIRSGAKESAMQAGGKIAKGLSAMSDEMKLAAESMQQRQTQQTAEKLDKAAKDLVFLSKGQEGMVASSGATSPQELARSQFQIHSGAAQVADDLEEVIRESFSLSRKLGSELGDALQKMEQATSEFEAGKKQSGLATSWKAVPSLNKAALQLMKTSSSLMSMSMASCNSPTGQDMARQEMQKLCSMQKGVNAGTQSLVQKLSDESGRLQRSTQEQLANLAARQEMIRRGMQEVAGELGDRKDVLGRLDQLAEEMQQVIDDMESRNVDRETVRRQQQILSRLLDAQRSVRRRDMDNQRISRVGIDQLDRTPPGAIPPELLDAEDRLKSEVLQGKADPIPQAYRRLVEEYFRAISSRGF